MNRIRCPRWACVMMIACLLAVTGCRGFVLDAARDSVAGFLTNVFSTAVDATIASEDD